MCPPTFRGPAAVTLAALFTLTIGALSSGGQDTGKIPWPGNGRYRILVEVPGHPTGDRKADEGPVRLAVDFPAALASLGVEGKCDPASIQVIRYDAGTGQPIPHGRFAFTQGIYDLPYRFDESDPKPYWFLYNMEGLGQKGTLVWTGVQEGEGPSGYAIYFDAVRPDRPAGHAVRAWIGDSDALFREEGELPSFIHTKPVPFDWDADGKLDLLIGDARGFVFLYRNVGTPADPKFAAPLFIQCDGAPLKVEWSASPTVADWNGDGLPDLLVGREPKAMMQYYQNVGTRAEPKLTYRGLLQADGADIALPWEPVPESPGVFVQDYTPVPEVVDWNGDGKEDLLLGGYVTGRIFYFENVGANADGTPTPASRGPLEADGNLIDVSWCATPTTADIDADGLRELVTGSMYVSPTGGELPAPGRPGLFMFENVGSATAPKLHEVPFPLEGEWEENYFLNPRFTDWDGDGLLDLIVGAMTKVIYFRNVGTKTAPLFRREGVFKTEWVCNSTHPEWVGDWRSDGNLALLGDHGGGGPTLSECTRRANPPLFDQRQELKTAAGTSMGHPPVHGDPWGASIAYDFDGDGGLDVVVGDVAGYIWYYRNIGTRAEPSFAEGEKFVCADGNPVITGIPPGTAITDFTVLQGNRGFPACGDFNKDGKTDLVVGDATGGVTYFQNLGDNEKPSFATGREIAKYGGRVQLCAADWNRDGLPDLIVLNGVIALTSLKDGEPQFGFPGTAIAGLCTIPYPEPSVADINGDGDEDVVFASSYGTWYFAERTYIEHGYGEGQVIGQEKR